MNVSLSAGSPTEWKPSDGSVDIHVPALTSPASITLSARSVDRAGNVGTCNALNNRIRYTYDTRVPATAPVVTLDPVSCPVAGKCTDTSGVGNALPPKSAADFVLGDAHGTACRPEITTLAERTLRDMGYRVRRNDPYAGGFITRHYGRPRAGIHALQIELNRALYMDEERITPAAGFDTVRADLTRLMAVLLAQAGEILLPGLDAQAAE